MKSKKAFTLIELLVVISIVSMLMAILTPALSRARKQSKATVCKSRIRQMLIASNMYIQTNDNHYPLAYCYKTLSADSFASYNWDLTTISSGTGLTVQPGLLWEGQGNKKIQQCPSFKGKNWTSDPYTGYNYNTSYIGRGQYERVSTSARAAEIHRPARCAVFGDGEYRAGANKFMRSPEKSPYDSQFSGRYAGTQGFRHLGATNIGWADGHVSSTRRCFDKDSKASASDRANIGEGTGFLSADNSAYSLK